MASGPRFVLALFAALTLFSLFLFFVGAKALELQFSVFLRPILVLAVVSSIFVGLFVAIDAKRQQRSGWWIYLFPALVPGLNLAVGLAWARRWRASRRRLGRWVL